MKTPKPDPPTVALDAAALDALRRSSRARDASASPGASDETRTTLYVRSTGSIARTRPDAAPDPTATVRALVATSSTHAVASRPRRHVRRLDTRALHARSRRAPWAAALAGAALAFAIALAIFLQPAAHPGRPAQRELAAAPAASEQPRARHSEPGTGGQPPSPTVAERDVQAVVPAVAEGAALRSSTPRDARPITPASAADALARADYPDALRRYRALAARMPEQPVFAAIARVLERDLARRCASSGDAIDGASPCPR